MPRCIFQVVSFPDPFCARARNLKLGGGERPGKGSGKLVSFPDPAPLRGREGLGTLVDFLGILCVSNHVTHAYAHAHFSNKRVIRELRIVSCLGGGVWVAVTREFERDNCVISEILQSDWTIPNRAGVPRKSTKVPRPSFRVWAGRSGHETTGKSSRPSTGNGRNAGAVRMECS